MNQKEHSLPINKEANTPKPIYQDLNADKLRLYFDQEYPIFRKDEKITITEIGRNEIDGDGFVNFVYRVCTESGACIIVKQAKPYLKFFGKDKMPLPPDRNEAEADINRIRAGIIPQYIPELIHIDKANHLYIAQDCGHLDIMRFGLARGKLYPHFPQMMGEYIAKSNFYTSELFLDQTLHKELGIRFSALDMSLIMERILFTDEELFDSFDSSAGASARHKILAGDFWNKRQARLELLRLRDIYMKKKECLVHGDLHTSNTLISGEEMKIIDMEYAHLGPFSSDMGYLLGNFVYVYAAWFFRDCPKEQGEKMRAAALDYIESTLRQYIAVFNQCWQKDVKALFSPYPEYLEDLIQTFVCETARFMGSQICSRICAFAETIDFDSIENPSKRDDARELALLIGHTLLMQGESLSKPQDITRLIRLCAAKFFTS